MANPREIEATEATTEEPGWFMSKVDDVSGWFQRQAISAQTAWEDFSAENPATAEFLQYGMYGRQIQEALVPTANAAETVDQEPAATVEQEPAVTAEQEPAVTTEQEPAVTTEQEPAVTTEQEPAATTGVSRTVFVPTGAQLTGDNHTDVQTIEAAFPAIEALIKATVTDLEAKGTLTAGEQKTLDILKTIPERSVDIADGYLDSNEIQIINTLSDALRAQILGDEATKVLLRGDEDSRGFTSILGMTANAGLGPTLQALVNDPSKSAIHTELKYFQEHRNGIIKALRDLKDANLLVATEGDITVETVQVPADPDGNPIEPAGIPAPPADADTATVDPSTLDLTESIYNSGAGDVKASIVRIEQVQLMAYEALNEMSPFFADLMNKPNQDGKFDSGELRNMSAMVMLMKKINGEENPNGTYDQAKLVQLREALLTEDSFAMLREKLKSLGIEKIEAGDSPAEQARKRQAADEALFQHLLILQKTGNIDPNAQNVTAANLAFDKIREFLPDWVKDMMQQYLGETGIGKMIMGVAAAKGMNLERLWLAPEDDPTYNETEVINVSKSDVLGSEFEKYVEAAEAELKGEGTTDPDFAAVLERAQTNLVNDIDNNKFNRIGTLVLGPEYDTLRNDLKTAIAATSGAENLADARTRLVTSVSGIDGVDLQALVQNTQALRQEVDDNNAGRSTSFRDLRLAVEPAAEPAAGQEGAQIEGAALTAPFETPASLAQNSAAQPVESVQQVVTSAATSPVSTIPVVDKEGIDPDKVATLGGDEKTREVVVEYERDPNTYVVLDVASNGRVQTILEALTSMEADKRPYDPEDLIRRTESGEIIDLAYKEHNGAFEKLAIIAQLDTLIENGATEIHMDQIERQITSDNLHMIEDFLDKNGVPEGQVEEAMTAAQSLIDQQVNGKSVMATQFGNWDQIRISEIREIINVIDPEVVVVTDLEPAPAPVIPEPEPFKPDSMSLPNRRGIYDLNAGPLAQVPDQQPVLQPTFAFESGPISAPIPCIVGSAMLPEGGTMIKGAQSCYATSDMPGYNGRDGANQPWSHTRVEQDPNDPYGRGRTQPMWTPFGISLGASDYDFRVDTSKDGLAQEKDEDRADTMYGRSGAGSVGLHDIFTWQGVKATPPQQDYGARTLAQEVIDTYYEYREKLDDAGKLSKATPEAYEQSVRYTDALDRAATMQLNVLRNPRMGRDAQVARIHEIQGQIEEYYQKVTGHTPGPVEINVEELFSDVTGSQAIEGYEEGIKEYFGNSGPLTDMAMEVLETYKEKVEAINNDEDISPQEARQLIAQELGNLDDNLDIVASLKEMTSPEAVAEYRAKIDENIGTNNPYAPRAYAQIDEFVDRSLNEILSDDDKLIQEKVDEVLSAFEQTSRGVDAIFLEKQQAEYALAQNGADAGVIDNGANVDALVADTAMQPTAQSNLGNR